jgi:hypothetical protein
VTPAATGHETTGQPATGVPAGTTVWECLVAAGVDLETARTGLDAYLTNPGDGVDTPGRAALTALQHAAQAAGAPTPAPGPETAAHGHRGAVILPLRRRRPVVGEAS